MREPKFKLGQKAWTRMQKSGSFKYEVVHDTICGIHMSGSSFYYDVGHIATWCDEQEVFLTEKAAKEKVDLENLSFDIMMLKRELSCAQDDVQSWERKIKVAPIKLKEARTEVVKIKKKLSKLQKKSEKMSQCHTS